MWPKLCHDLHGVRCLFKFSRVGWSWPPFGQTRQEVDAKDGECFVEALAKRRGGTRVLTLHLPGQPDQNALRVLGIC